MLLTVTKMAKKLNLSRSRFNQLIGSVFPRPKYHSVTNKPYYDEAQQDVCFQIRQTGIGIDGQVVLFNETKPKSITSPTIKQAITSPTIKQAKPTDEQLKRKGDLRRYRQYGLAPGEYEVMLMEQKGCCRICGNKPNKALHVDHCHQTGAVRGLLCSDCNTAIGLFRENSDIMRKAIRYLEDTSSWKQSPLVFSK